MESLTLGEAAGLVAGRLFYFEPPPTNEGRKVHPAPRLC